MVHVYNCHPFASQQIVPTEQEPGLFCCGGDVLFVVSAVGCKIEAFSLQEDRCTPFCRFSTMGNVLRIAHSEVDTGDLLVGCEKSLIIFKLKNEVLHEQLSALDFERFLILHVPGWIPTAVCYCAGYIAVQIDLEVLVVKLEYVQKSSQDVSIMLGNDERTDDKPDLKRQASQNETDDFCIFQKHQEMLGQAAVECGVSVTPEKTGVDFDEDIKIQYILYRRFAPDFFQGHTVEETQLRSLSLLPIYRTGDSNHCGDVRPRELLNMLCFFSLPNTGYLYSLKSPVELISNYQYPEKALAAVLSTRFLYVITSHDLQCFTVRCSALAARLEDPYMDTTMRDIAEQVLTIFSSTEPSQLPHVVCSPSMINGNPATTFTCLEKWEAITPSVTVTLTKAAIALKMKDLQLYKRQMDRHAEMLQVYGFIEEPKLLIHRTPEGIKPTALACHLRETQDGLLVAATVALHENGKMKLTEADVFFKVLCKETGHTESEPQLLVDFWEALLVASAQESIIQDLLFKLVSVYIHRISAKENLGIKPLKTAEDLINSSTHYGLIFPWVTVITPAHFNIAYEYQEDLQKLQALWWQKLLPELCERIKSSEDESDILLFSLKGFWRKKKLLFQFPMLLPLVPLPSSSFISYLPDIIANT
ncbi:HPS3 protein, partial [Polypterus senegalus]